MLHANTVLPLASNSKQDLLFHDDRDGRGRGRQRGRQRQEIDAVTVEMPFSDNLEFATDLASASGRIPRGGGGGLSGGRDVSHESPEPSEEVGGNNLSYAAIWAEDVPLAMRGTELEFVGVNPYDSDGDGIPDLINGYRWYPQQDPENTWQAENATASDLSEAYPELYPDGKVFVDRIDVTDSLEVVDWTVGRPVRLEWVLYKDLNESMKNFTMKSLEGEHRDEIYGTNGETYDSFEATVYSPYAELTIQPISEDASNGAIANDIEWQNDRWVDTDLTDNGGESEVGSPIDPGCSFGSEINAAGKTIYGTTQGAWKPKEAGDYRVTFSLPLDGKTLLDNAQIIPIVEGEELVTASSSEVEGDDPGGIPGGGTAIVVPDDNLTYIDIHIRPRSGGGGSGGGSGGGTPDGRGGRGGRAALFATSELPELQYAELGAVPTSEVEALGAGLGQEAQLMLGIGAGCEPFPTLEA